MSRDVEAGGDEHAISEEGQQVFTISMSSFESKSIEFAQRYYGTTESRL